MKFARGRITGGYMVACGSLDIPDADEARAGWMIPVETWQAIGRVEGGTESVTALTQGGPGNVFGAERNAFQAWGDVPQRAIPTQRPAPRGRGNEEPSARCRITEGV